MNMLLLNHELPVEQVDMQNVGVALEDGHLAAHALVGFAAALDETLADELVFWIVDVVHCALQGEGVNNGVAH